MSLMLQGAKEKSAVSSEKTAKALDAYLSGAVKRMSNLSNFEAEQTAIRYAKEADISEISASDVRAKQKEVAKQMKGHSLKDKFAYWNDPNSADRDEFNKLSNMAVGLTFVTSALMLSTGDKTAETVTVFSTSAAIIAAKALANYVNKHQTEENKKTAAEYAELKHTQLALKQLKRRLAQPKRAEYKQEVKKLFASYGNPSGGFVNNALKGRSER